MQDEVTNDVSREVVIVQSESESRIGVSNVEVGSEQGIHDDEPVLTIYRTNGFIWASIIQYADGTEEPSEIFGTRQEMLSEATRRFPVTIEYRPQILGCEASDEELEAVPVFASAYDLLLSFGRTHMV